MYGVELTDDYLDTIAYSDLMINISAMDKGLFGNLMKLRYKGINNHKMPKEQKMSREELQEYNKVKLPKNVDLMIYRAMT